jgi:Animal haem peroxidase
MSQSSGRVAHETGSRVLTDVSHGGHLLARHGDHGEPDPTTPFDYLFEGLAGAFPDQHLPDTDPAAVVAALEALGAAMVEDPPLAADPLQPLSNSTIPPVYTYWGQFVDHDLTANTDRDSAISDITRPDLAPLEPEFVVENLRNLRQPALNLDSVYGDGPTLSSSHPSASAALYDGIKLKVGAAAEVSTNPARPIGGVKIPPEADLARDLPRAANGTATIGDARNDENLIVAQLHTAFLRFHNAAVDWVAANEPGFDTDREIFGRARQLTQWHYQWLTIHDFLKTVTLGGVADQVLLGGNRFWAPRHGRVWMPLEYSVATYRFGHSMVRAVYDYNRNFGRPGTNILGNAPFNLLFTFTGKAQPPFRGDTAALPFNWVIEWDRFVDHGAAFPDRFARKIDTRLAPPLRALLNEGNDPALVQTVKDILKRLATRNLLRGYLLAIPTGQAVAGAMAIAPLTAAELQRDNNPVVNDALAAGGFLERTPLWYYVLKEAEVRANGNSLGPVGSRIVCETIVGQVREDHASYLRQPGTWTPEEGVRLADGQLVVTIADFLRFAGVLTT